MKMENSKKQNVKEIYTLPELQMNDEEYTQYMKEQLKKSYNDLKNGRVLTLEELKKHIEELEEQYANNNIK